MRTFGLIPAAGKSRRMGRPKLALRVGARTVLEHALDAVRAAGVEEVLVVLGPHGEALRQPAERAGAHVLLLAEETADMRATCLRGLDWLEARFRPRPDDGWLLLPADHPTVRPDVVRALLDMVPKHPAGSIFVPAHAGRRGHPVWLRWSHVAAILGLVEGEGLNAYVRRRVDETVELAWPSDDVLRDLDTPEDYEQLLGERRA
jgi:molybdenum cofactor cytidylyltransferase